MRTLIIVAGMLLCGPSAYAQEGPAISFGSDTVTVTGLNGFGGAAWFSVSRSRPGPTTRVTADHGVLETRYSPSVTITPDHPVSAHSVWAAVDMISGDFVVAAPPDAVLREVTAPGEVSGNIGYSLATIPLEFPYAHVFVVRAESGAWYGFADDGGSDDTDRSSDGSLHVAPGSLTPVADSGAPPNELLPGDVIVTINPSNLCYWAVRLFGMRPMGA